MQMVAQGIVLQAGELDLLDDRSGIAESFAKRRHGRPNAAWILLGDGDGNLKRPRRAHEPHATLDDALGVRHRREQLFLDVDDEQL